MAASGITEDIGKKPPVTVMASVAEEVCGSSFLDSLNVRNYNVLAVNHANAYHRIKVEKE